MPLQSKTDRFQLQFFALEQEVDHDSIVRIVDLFCLSIDFRTIFYSAPLRNDQETVGIHPHTSQRIKKGQWRVWSYCRLMTILGVDGLKKALNHLNFAFIATRAIIIHLTVTHFSFGHQPSSTFSQF